MAGKSAIPMMIGKARERIVNRFEAFELVIQFIEVALVSKESSIAGSDITNVEFVSRQNEIAGEVVKTFQKSERHCRRQKRAQDRTVKIQMRRLGHIAQISVDSFGIN